VCYNTEKGADMKLENRAPYHFTPAGIQRIEQQYDAKYMGYWCAIGANGGWMETPLDVFYVQNPDTSKGHSNYFGMFTRNDQVYITNALSCFSEPMTGIVENGVVYVSRYRHDYVVTPTGVSIDGGRDYVKTGLMQPAATSALELAEQKLTNKTRFVSVQVNADEFEFIEHIQHAESE